MRSLVVIAALCCVSATEPSLNLPCTIVEVYDGDTVTVEITVRARVRLLDCWAPELRDKGGKESRDNLKRFENRPALLVVPLAGADRLDDVFSFGRILGHVMVDGRSLAVEQVESGHATELKQ